MFWKKSGNEKLTPILYGSDFHGSEAVFRKSISAAFQYKANVLIVGGDVTGKAMVPVVHRGGGVYVGHLFGSREELSSREQLEKFTKTVSNVGFYPIIVEKDEAAALERDQEMLNARFEEAMCQRVRQWMILAQEKLVPTGIQFFFMPGNDDLQSIDDIIAEFEQVHNPHMRRFQIMGGYEVLGNSNANMTPWACARDLEEDDLEHKMQELAELVGDPQRAICAIRVPPFQSGLDTCPELDKNLKIVTMGGQVMMKAAGSPAVRKFIERVQPLLTLHGHIHESPGHTRIGHTLCIGRGGRGRGAGGGGRRSRGRTRRRTGSAGAGNGAPRRGPSTCSASRLRPAASIR